MAFAQPGSEKKIVLITYLLFNFTFLHKFKELQMIFFLGGGFYKLSLSKNKL
jgi:hypothetical protein